MPMLEAFVVAAGESDVVATVESPSLAEAAGSVPSGSAAAREHSIGCHGCANTHKVTTVLRIPE